MQQENYTKAKKYLQIAYFRVWYHITIMHHISLDKADFKP